MGTVNSAVLACRQEKTAVTLDEVLPSHAFDLAVELPPKWKRQGLTWDAHFIDQGGNPGRYGCKSAHERQGRVIVGLTTRDAPWPVAVRIRTRGSE